MAKIRKPFKYPVIDSKRTGRQIKTECRKQGLTVREIQDFLQIGAAQSIYDWFQGKSLPALDNMVALSRLLGVPMENLIVCRTTCDRQLIACRTNKYNFERVSVYYRRISGCAA